MPIKTVFLSSTARDLTQYRGAAYEAIEGLDGYHCVRMEDFGARDAMSDEFCQSKVAECDVFVGIVGHCYGSTPKDSDKSYTEQEYDAAISTNKPRLMFLAPKDFPLPADCIEADDKRGKQSALQARVNADRIRGTFTSPDDLGRRVVQAVRNWEQEQATVEARPSARQEGMIPLPPQPYFAHPYPLPENWTGRRAEMDQLGAWVKDDDGAPMCCLIAIGGMGKSSMAWTWLQDRVVPEQETLALTGIFQWSFYEGEVSFARFLEDLSAYLGVAGVSDPVTAVTQALSKHRVLLVLDGFERLLQAYASADAALLPERTADELESGERRCTDWPTARFLRSLLASTANKTLLISRLVPEDIDGLKGWLPTELTGLDPADAVAYLRATGIKGTDRELQDAAAAYGFHPLSLSKLVNVLHYDVDKPDDISQAPRYDVTMDLKARQHHIRERAYDTLPAGLQQFLSALAALRGKATMDVARFLAGDCSDDKLSARLRRLEEDKWISWDRNQQTLDFHPVVRRYAYKRLEGKEKIHARLAGYFKPLADQVNTKEAESVAELAPVIELYHHTGLAGQYDEAFRLLEDRLVPSPLYFRFAAYQTMIELKRALLPDGEHQPPRLKTDVAKVWTLNSLANSYSLSGQPRRALSVWQVAMPLAKKQDDNTNLSICLGNLAYMAQLPLGELAAEEENLWQKIEMKVNDFDVAVGHQELGHLLSYNGALDEAVQELDGALASFAKLGATQSECVVWSHRAPSAPC